jgi:hypothetical protein
MRLTGATVPWNLSPLNPPNLPHCLHASLQSLQSRSQTINWMDCLYPRRMTNTPFHLEHIYPQVYGLRIFRGTFAYDVKPCKTATVHQLFLEPSAPASASISTVVYPQKRTSRTLLFTRLTRRRTRLHSLSTSSLMLCNPTTSDNVSRTKMRHMRSSKPTSPL